MNMDLVNWNIPGIKWSRELDDGARKLSDGSKAWIFSLYFERKDDLLAFKKWLRQQTKQQT